MLAVHLVAADARRPRAVDRQRGLHPAVSAVLRVRRTARRRLQQAHRAVVSKSLEIVAARWDWSRFAFGHLQLTYGVLFLIALQATFFSPAKYGILPEMLPDRDLSRANGVLEMSTFVAIVLGTAVGGYLFDAWQAQLWLIGVLVVGVAVVGTAVELRNSARPGGRAGPAHRPEPVGRNLDGHRTLRRDRVLWLTVIGISYFWFLGFAAAARGHPVRDRSDGARATPGSAC